MTEALTHKQKLVAKFELEEVRECLVCKHNIYQPIIGLAWEGLGFSYCLCENCGFKFMNPRPTGLSYVELFKSNYWQDRMAAKSFATGSSYDNNEIDQMKLRMPKYKNVYRKVSRDLSSMLDLNEDTQILEVGCAFGYTLKWLNRDYGCQVYGIEPSDLAYERCENTGIIKMLGRTAQDYFLRPNKINKQFDVIFFRHVFEAILDLEEITVALKDCLKENGLLVIYTPNDYFYELNDPYHPYVFNPDTINYFLIRCGFEIIQSRHTPTPKDLSTAIAQPLVPSYEIVVFAKHNKNASARLHHIKTQSNRKLKRIGETLLASRELSVSDIMSILFNRITNKLANKFK